jgi:NAD-dependent DNA ligase
VTITQAIEVAPIVEKVVCNNRKHAELIAASTFTRCPDCRRPLFRAPEWKCKQHSIYRCPTCPEGSVRAPDGVAGRNY